MANIPIIAPTAIMQAKTIKAISAACHLSYENTDDDDETITGEASLIVCILK